MVLANFLLLLSLLSGQTSHADVASDFAKQYGCQKVEWFKALGQGDWGRIILETALSKTEPADLKKMFDDDYSGLQIFSDKLNQTVTYAHITDTPRTPLIKTSSGLKFTPYYGDIVTKPSGTQHDVLTERMDELDWGREPKFAPSKKTSPSGYVTYSGDGSFASARQIEISWQNSSEKPFTLIFAKSRGYDSRQSETKVWFELTRVELTGRSGHALIAHDFSFSPEQTNLAYLIYSPSAVDWKLKELKLVEDMTSIYGFQNIKTENVVSGAPPEIASLPNRVLKIKEFIKVRELLLIKDPAKKSGFDAYTGKISVYSTKDLNQPWTLRFENTILGKPPFGINLKSFEEDISDQYWAYSLPNDNAGIYRIELAGPKKSIYFQKSIDEIDYHIGFGCSTKHTVQPEIVKSIQDGVWSHSNAITNVGPFVPPKDSALMGILFKIGYGLIVLLFVWFIYREVRN